MTTDTAIAPASAGDLNDEDAQTAFEALAAARHVPAEDAAHAVVEDPPEPTEETSAAPAAVEVPAPVPVAAAPAAASTDIWSSATPELRAAHDAALERERQRYNSDLGRQAAYQRQIQSLKDQIAGGTATPAAPAAPAATTSLRENPVIVKSLEEYAEVGLAPVLDALESANAETARIGRALASLEEDRRAGVIASQEQALTAAHPDWQQACASKDFADWLESQPASIKKIVAENGEQVVNAEDAIAMVGNFKAHFALTHPAPPVAVPVTPPAPTNLSDRRAAQLAAVTATPKGAPAAIPDGPVGGAEAAVFDHFVKKKALKG